MSLATLNTLCRFNGVDWTGATHKLGIGLPPHTKNSSGWGYKRPLLTNPLIKPTQVTHGGSYAPLQM